MKTRIKARQLNIGTIFYTPQYGISRFVELKNEICRWWKLILFPPLWLVCIWLFIEACFSKYSWYDITPETKHLPDAKTAIDKQIFACGIAKANEVLEKRKQKARETKKTFYLKYP